MPALVIASGLVAAILLVSYANRAHAEHPQPRPGVTAQDVVPASRYAGSPRIAEVYREAALVPAVLDGLHCYCECAKHAGHYSLLDCFKSDHGAGCDVCLTEAAMAYRLAQEGKTLDQIRSAIDGLYQL